MARPNDVNREKRAAAIAAELKVIADAAAEARAVIANAAANAIATLTTAAAVQSRDIEYIKDGMRTINEKLDKFDSIYLTRDQFASQFEPVKRVAYGVVYVLGVINLAVLAAILKLVIIK